MDKFKIKEKVFIVPVIILFVLMLSFVSAEQNSQNNSLENYSQIDDYQKTKEYPKKVERCSVDVTKCSSSDSPEIRYGVITIHKVSDNVDNSNKQEVCVIDEGDNPPSYWSFQKQEGCVEVKKLGYDETQDYLDKSKITSEQVKCVFKNSDELQKCYAYNGDLEFYCSGVESCVVDVKGYEGDKLIWKSSCGGYAYTLIDEDNEDAEFKCFPSGEVNEDEIKDLGFKFSHWQCYDGSEETQGGSEDSCKPSKLWKSYAEEFCEDRCTKDGKKCGVNSIGFSSECYYLKNEIEKEKEAIKVFEEEDKQILMCKDSCPFKDKCYPFGYRKSGEFCSDEGTFIKQLAEESPCDNNFECSSNLCLDNKCVSSSLIEKIINWFKKIFTGE
ncbi:MAG: hypothetical protein QW727_02440 [Candidatus Pacearchaeota archaeon]